MLWLHLLKGALWPPRGEHRAGAEGRGWEPGASRRVRLSSPGERQVENAGLSPGPGFTEGLSVFPASHLPARLSEGGMTSQTLIVCL